MKTKTVLFLLLFISVLSTINAQSADPIIMTINGEPVLKSEFEYIYNKNNSNNSIDKKSLDEYVDLFVNFKLKVEEAKAQGLDTTKAFIKELGGYRSQLTKPYLTDSEADEAVIREAYNRMKEDIDVSHILIRVEQGATPKDTLEAYNKAMNAYKRLAKESFEKVAKEISEDQSVEKNGGHIGWITAFRTIYPFETMAYNTPVGTYSKPVRTMFGYHIVKVNNRRNSLGEISVSHIMKFTQPDNPTGNETAKHSIDSIYQRIQAGDDFGELASKYSDDKSSAVKNGELPLFGTGRMVPEFENAAFSLVNKGDVSKPVLSPYGWHIIKLNDKKGLDSLQDLKGTIEQQVKRDERSNRGQEALIQKLKAEYNYRFTPESLNPFKSLLVSDVDSTYFAAISTLNNPLFSFANKKYTQADFAGYLKQNRFSGLKGSGIIDAKLKEFTDHEILNYEDSQLEKKYPDFGFLMQEYHDGILLFEVSNNEVWERASKDTEGLSNYFKDHRSDYKWEKPHYKGRVIYAKDKATLKAAKSIVKKAPNDSIDKFLRTRLNDSIQYVKIEKGLFVQGDNKAIDQEVFKVKKAYQSSEEYPYMFVIGKLLKNTPEDYTDMKGLVTADYQDYLEKEWIKKLREKYKVTVDERVLKTVKKN